MLCCSPHHTWRSIAIRFKYSGFVVFFVVFFPVFSLHFLNMIAIAICRLFSCFFFNIKTKRNKYRGRKNAFGCNINWETHHVFAQYANYPPHNKQRKKTLQCSMSTNSCFQRASNEVHLVFDLIWSVLKLAFIYGDSLNYLIELKIKWKVLPINDWWDCIKLACICNVNASIYAHGARDVTSISLCS